MISMTQDRLKLLEQVDEDERVRRIREDREKEMMEIKNDDKIKKLIKEVEGLKEEVEDLEKEVARVKENNIILTCKVFCAVKSIASKLFKQNTFSNYYFISSNHPYTLPFFHSSTPSFPNYPPS